MWHLEPRAKRHSVQSRGPSKWRLVSATMPLNDSNALLDACGQAESFRSNLGTAQISLQAIASVVPLMLCPKG